MYGGDLWQTWLGRRGLPPASSSPQGPHSCGLGVAWVAMRTKWGSPRKLLAPSRLTTWVHIEPLQTGRPPTGSWSGPRKGGKEQTPKPATRGSVRAAVIVPVSPGGPLTCHVYPSGGRLGDERHGRQLWGQLGKGAASWVLMCLRVPWGILLEHIGSSPRPRAPPPLDSKG